MNLLEHYIKEVISVTPCPFETDYKGKHLEFKEAVEAMLRVNCYGSEEIVTKIYADKKELEEDLEKGYYLG